MPIVATLTGNKLYLSANDLREKSWDLVEQIVNARFFPDYLIAVWRGGTVIGMYLHEVFKRLGLKMDHYPIKAGSYSGVRQRSKVVLEGMEVVLRRIKKNNYQNILLVDDVFETGHTLKVIKQRLPAVNVKIAVPYWKEDANETELRPDFYVENLSKKTWIVFPHEFEGLSDEEIKIKGSVYDRLQRMKSIIQP